MKHQVCTLLLLATSLSLYGDGDKYTIADKSKRIGRFSYEDSFDENLVEDVLKHSPATVKKNIKKLLYPSADEEVPQRLLLLGGTSNASTTAIAKTIALRCGYEYYVIDAAALLREYREGRQMLLTEVRPIIKSGKPIALIITELPEMADYSGVLASTLWLLVDQCAQYQDVLVIGTSAFTKAQLSEDIKERFGENIIPVILNKSMQDGIEIAASQASWVERHKTACIVAGSFTLISVFAGLQFYLINLLEQQPQKNEKKLIDMKSDFNEKKVSLQETLQSVQAQQSNISLPPTILEEKNSTIDNEQAWVEQKEQMRIAVCGAFVLSMIRMIIIGF